jgi:Polyketide cyclase / dehydrase and lipid transport
MLRRFRLLSGAALSAGLKYLFDPRGERRRRAVIRDTVSSLADQRGRAVEVAFRDMGTRAAGRLTRIRSWIGLRQPIDHEIAERIAGKVRTMVRQPGAIRIGAALAIVGLSLLARGLSNRTAAPTIGRHAITIRKMVNVAAPVREVFEFWRRYENWPRVMPHVREVREIALDRHRWAIAGPEGTPSSGSPSSRNSGRTVSSNGKPCRPQSSSTPAVSASKTTETIPLEWTSRCPTSRQPAPSGTPWLPSSGGTARR